MSHQRRHQTDQRSQWVDGLQSLWTDALYAAAVDVCTAVAHIDDEEPTRQSMWEEVALGRLTANRQRQGQRTRCTIALLTAQHSLSLATRLQHTPAVNASQLVQARKKYSAQHEQSHCPTGCALLKAEVRRKWEVERQGSEAKRKRMNHLPPVHHRHHQSMRRTDHCRRLPRQHQSR